MNDEYSTQDFEAQSAVLAAFSRALTFEAHVLRQHPHLLWQQLYNRLQWEDDLGGAPFAEELKKRIAAGMPAWMRQRVRPGESQALRKTFVGDENETFVAEISPDGRFFISACRDTTINVWDAKTGALQHTLAGNPSSIRGCAFSRDGRRAVSKKSTYNTLLVWDTNTGNELMALRGHQKYVSCYAVSQDGNWIISGGEDEDRDATLNVWDAKTGSLQHTLYGHRYSIHDCAISPDGRWTVSASADTTLMLWDRARGRRKATLKGHQKSVYACAFSPDGETIISGGDDQTLILWRRSGLKKLVRRFEGHTGRIWSCAFSPDGKHIVSAGEDKTLRVWDPHSGRELSRILAHNDSVYQCSFSPDGCTILSASRDGTLKFWDFEALLQEGSSQGDPDTLVRHSLSPRGDYMLATSPGGVLKVRDMLEGTEIQTLSAPTDWVEAVAISPDQHLAASCSRGELNIWDTGTWNLIRTIPKVYARRCYFSPDSRVVIGAQWPRMFRAWVIDTGKQFRAMEVPTGFDEGAWDIDLSPDGRTLLYANSFSQKIARFDIRTGELLNHYRAHDHGLISARYSPDGRWFITTSKDHTLKIWGEKKHTLAGHTASVYDCAISPDGCWAVSTSADGILKVWDTPAGVERLTLSGHTQPVRACDISPDGRWILSVGDDFLLRIWEAESGQGAAACYLANPKVARFHPIRPALLTLDTGGHYQVLDLENIQYGPLVVTAADLGEGPELRCPHCWRAAQLEAAWLGQEVPCPYPDCQARLKVNPFVIAMVGV